MADLTLNISQYDPLKQFTVRPWETFSPDDQLAITDKINLIIQTLNRLGKLSNDVVTDWNKVMTWVSNDGMTAEVDSQLQKWKDDGTLVALINAYTGIGDLSTLQTVAKDTLVNAINENVTHLADIAINVRNFGAKGDGLTDDTAAIQRALDSIPNGGTVILPYGTFLITYSLLVGSNTTIRGLGRNSIIKAQLSNTLCSAIINKNIGTMGGYTAAENIEVRDFAIQSNANGIGFSHAQHIRVFNIYGNDNNLTWHYVDLTGVKDVTVQGCTFIYSGTTGQDLVQLDACIVDSAVSAQNPDGSRQGTLVDGTGCTDIFIKENHLKRDGDFQAGLIVFHRDPVSNVYITNNILEYGYAGVYMQTGNYYNVQIKGNNIIQFDRGTKSYTEGASYGINIAPTSVDTVIIKDNNLSFCGISASNVTNELTIDGNTINTFYRYNQINSTGKVFINNNKIKTYKASADVVTSFKNVFLVDGTITHFVVKNNQLDNSAGVVDQTGLKVRATCNFVEIEGNDFNTLGSAYDAINLRALTNGTIEFTASIKNLKVIANHFYNSVGAVGIASTTTLATQLLIRDNRFNTISHPLNIAAAIDVDNVRVLNNDFDTTYVGILKSNSAKNMKFTNVEINGNVFNNVKNSGAFLEGSELSFFFNNNKILSGTFDGSSTPCPVYAYANDTTGFLKGTVNDNRFMASNNKIYFSCPAANAHVYVMRNEGDFTPYFSSTMNSILKIEPYNLYATPSIKVKGTMYFDNVTNNTWMFWNGTAWTAV